jgi:DNA-binding CsgD family transcriptional regulator
MRPFGQYARNAYIRDSVGAVKRESSDAQGVDTDALLDLVGEATGLLDLHEFRAGLLDALRRAVPADWVSVNDLGPDPESAYVLIDPPFPPEAHELFARLAYENPLIVRHGESGDGRAYRFSDVVSRRELHALALYREFYGPIGLEHQVAFTLPHDRGRLLGVALSRRERDFGDEEVALLNRARPFLIQAYRNAIAYSTVQAELKRARAAELPPAEGRLGEHLAARRVTAREVEVLRWVAAGRSDGDIASALGISARTVQKHVERSFRKLAVRSRADAARLVWSLAGDEAEAAGLP